MPVLGYAYGGTAELVEHHERVSGAARDVDGLMTGLAWLRAHPSAAQRPGRGRQNTQARAIEQYAAIHHDVAAGAGPTASAW